MRRGTSRRGLPGFTLIEIVVAAMIALLVIAGLYVVYAGHARVFRTQEMVAQAQTGARFGMEILKEDLERAGAMIQPDTNEPGIRQHICRIPNVDGDRIQAVRLVHNSGAVPVPQNVMPAGSDSNPTQRPDELTLMGNYTDSEEYWVDEFTGRAILLQDTSAADVTSPFPANATEFNNIFPTDNTALVRVRLGAKSFYSVIDEAAFANKRLSVLDNTCVAGTSEGARLNVVNQIRYSVQLASAAGTLTPRERNMLAGPPPNPPNISLQNRTDLIRDVIDWTDGTPVLARREVVAQYVVDFQVWFLFSDISQPALGPSVDQRQMVLADNLTGNNPCNGGTLGTGPNCLVSNAHAALVRLSVRTSREDPNFLMPPGVRAPLQWYQVDPRTDFAARVRTLVTQVSLRNIEFGN